MQNILKNQQTNKMSGFKKIFLAEENEVDKIEKTNETNEWVYLKPNYYWGEIESNKIELNVNFEEDYLLTEVTCTLKGITNTYNHLFSKMIEQKFIIKLVDNMNKIWVIGNLEEPLNFKYAHIGKNDPADVHEYQLTFYRKTTIPLYQYEETPE